MKDINLKPIQYSKFIVEECEKVNIDVLMNKIKHSLKQALLRIELKGLGEDIKLTSSKTGNGGTRYWFFCPKCNRRIGTLYRQPGGNSFCCRNCQNLRYGAAKYHKTPQEKHMRAVKLLLKKRKKGLI